GCRGSRRKFALARANSRWKLYSGKTNTLSIGGSRRTHSHLHLRATIGYPTSTIKTQTSNFKLMNIGFVGVGRMGANMARRLKDQKFNITAVYDTNRKIATELAVELVCAAAQDLSQVTAESDVIFTVVTDDNAMRRIFSDSGDNLLKNARGKLCINCATISPRVLVDVEKLAEKAGAESLEACMASSITQAREGKL